jgi:pimeloyl-ACP methyl ester carboxylesterase
MSVAGAEPREIETPRCRIAYWEAGSGEPVLCLHGFPDHPLGMRTLTEGLTQAGYRVVCPALPGYWPSSAVADGDYGLAAVSEDILRLADALGLGRVRLVGHDWGAAIAYRLGAYEPERVERIVAMAVPPAPGFRIRRTVMRELRTAWYAYFLAYGRDAAATARDSRWLTALAQSWSPGLRWPEWGDVVTTLCRPGVLEAVCAYYRADLDGGLDARPVAVPATVLHGGQDGCIGAMSFRDLEACFSASFTLRLFPELGHWPHVEDPAQVLPAVVAGLE